MTKAARMLRIGFGLTALLAAGVALGADPQPWQLNMGPGVTEVSREVYWLHNLILWICTIIGLLVFGAMGYAMFAFRKSKGAVPATFSHNAKAEVIWTAIPVVILVLICWPSTKTLYKMYDASESEMTVKVTGYQWMWKYEILNYRGEQTGVSFASRLDAQSNAARRLGSGVDPSGVTDGEFKSYLLNVDNPLVLPTDTKIRFVLTADDVIHSWWVPAFGWKQDAIPGMVNEQWTRIDTPGTYRGQCAELCGKDHGFMPIVVRAVPRAEFEGWLSAQPGSTYGQEAERTAQVDESAPVVPTQG
ncbi:cytochrome c oxidase subunit II [Denitratimonas tolerans]|jgi:cytochrome c oxidase subunit 2